MITGSYRRKKGEVISFKAARNVMITKRTEGNKTILEIVPQ